MYSIIKKTKLNELISFFPKLNKIDKIYLYEHNSFYILPRYFKKYFNFQFVTNWEDKTFIPKKINTDIIFNIDLRFNQIELIRILKNQFDQNKNINGVIKAIPGFGKTVCSLQIINTFKFKTLIVVDNNKLVQQWKDEILKYTNLKDEDIGMIIGNKFIPKDITITLVQTLLSKVKSDFIKTYNKIKDEGFDLIIFDEVHKTSSAIKYASSSLLFNTKNIIGLTATPYGNDIQLFFMKTVIGEIIYEFNGYDNKLDYNFIMYNSKLNENIKNKILMYSDYIKRIAIYNREIPNSFKYLSVLLILIKKLLIDNRKIIILVITIKQIDVISDFFEKHNIKTTKLYSKQQQIDKLNDNVIIATYKLASHGFDYPELSALILASPLRGKVSLIQSIGRILRSFHDKKQPIVYDLIDNDFKPIFSNLNIKKKIISNEFKIETFNIINNIENIN